MSARPGWPARPRLVSWKAVARDWLGQDTGNG